MYAYPVELGEDIDPAAVEQKPISGGWVLFIGVWLLSCVAGLSVVVFLKQPILGMLIVALPTVIGLMSSPTFAMCCIALALPLSGSITYQGFLTVDRVVGAVGTLGILFHCKFIGRGLFWRGSPLLPMFILSFWAILSGIWAPNHQFAFVTSLTLIQLCIWSYAVWNAVAYGGNFIWPMRCYVVGMLLVVMRLYLTGGLDRIARASGVDSRLTIGGTNEHDVNPNDFATFLAGGFIVSVYLIMRDPAKTLRVLWAGSGLVFPIMILLTGARSTVAGIAAALIVTAFTFHNMLKSKGMLIGVLVGGAFVAVGINFVLTSRYAKTETVQRIFDSKSRNKSASNRIGLMERGLKNIIKRPLLGTGYKNYTIATPEKHAIHNDVMLIAAELGLFAMVLYLLYFWKLLVGSILTRSPPEKWLLRTFAVYFFVTGMAHPLFVLKSTWFFTILPAALAYRARKLSEENTQLQLASYQQQEMLEPVPPAWGRAYSSNPSYG